MCVCQMSRVISAGVFLEKCKLPCKLSRSNALYPSCTKVHCTELEKSAFSEPLVWVHLWGFVMMFKANTVLFGDIYRQIQ